MSLKDMFLAANPNDGEQILADAKKRREAMKADWQEALKTERTALLAKLRDEVERLKPIDVLSMDKYRLTTHGEGHWLARYQSEVLALLEKGGE